MDLRSVGVRFTIWSAESAGEFSLVEHPIPPQTLVAPLRLHEREDVYSDVLECRMGRSSARTWRSRGRAIWCLRPPNQWHTSWNAGDTTYRILEIISPAGFEHSLI